MSDMQLRVLEREWKTSRSVEDQAAWLAARVRFGDVERDALTACAYLGHEGAQRALGVEQVPAITTPWPTVVIYERDPVFSEWASELARLDRAVVTRVALAATHRVRNWRMYPDRAALQNLETAARDWLTTGSLDEDQLRGLLAQTDRRDRYRPYGWRSSAELAGHATHAAANTILEPDQLERAMHCSFLALLASRVSVPMRGRWSRQPVVTERQTREKILRAIRSQIIPWALNGADPLLA